MSFTGSAHAATILVNTATAANAPGSCTVVDAATSINQASLVGSCTNSGGAFGSNDKIDLSGFSSATAIVFQVGMPMTATSALALTKPVTISGNLDSSGKPLVAITRANQPLNVRLIDTTANLTLSGIQLSNGHPTTDGGGIRAGVNVNLTLVNSTLSSNTAGGSGGGIKAQAMVTLINSSIDSNSAVGSGGGIEAQATVTLINSSIDSNSAVGPGGGIDVAGAQGLVTATGSTISSNSATTSSGGGINANAVSLTDSTVSGNSAGTDGGGIYTQNATLNFCTISENFVLSSGIGGGLAIGSQAAPTLTVTATIIYGNIQGDDIDSSIARTFAGNHNLVGVVSHNINVPADTLGCDPNLDLLADNGGPTLTYALSVTSCAIDAGPVFPPGTIPSDQRGSHYARRVGNATDIGAYEVTPTPTNDRIFYDGFGL
jgi:predicted outer membrane repeat protein